jgi:AcrR family transcriptional regulator
MTTISKQPVARAKRSAGRGMGKTRRTRGLSHEKTGRTRAAIVSAALEEFLAKGFTGATMSGVAERAGVAKGTTYRYFANKEEVFEGVVQDIITDPLDLAEHIAMGENETLGDYFRRTLLPVMSIIEVEGRSAIAGLVLAEGNRFPILARIYYRKVIDPIIDYIVEHVEIARERGEKCNDILLEQPHLMLAPLWMGIVQNCILDPSRPLDIGALFEAQIDLLFPRSSPSS